MVSEGKISEWNEATLKIIRIHELQRDINHFKIHPFKKTDGEFNYQLWYRTANALRGEGDAKYKQKEKDECNKYEKVIEFLLETQPSHTTVQVGSLGGTRVKHELNKVNWDKLKRVLQAYEYIVRQYNDDHGLSTTNRDSSGYF